MPGLLLRAKTSSFISQSTYKHKQKGGLGTRCDHKTSFKALFLFSYIIDDKEKCFYLTPWIIGGLSLAVKYMGFRIRREEAKIIRIFRAPLYCCSRHPIGVIFGDLVISSLL